MSGLHADSIVKSYGDRKVLSDVYLRCDVGEVVCLFGRNGCGKSTMLKIILGAVDAESRFVKADGKVLDSLAESSRLIKYLPQESFLPDHLRVDAIIRLFCGKSGTAILREYTLVRPLLAKKSRELSGGERSVLETLLLIHSQGNYILLDEPFNGVSPIHVEKIKSAVRSQTVTKGFIVTNHNYRDVLDISDRIVLIHDQVLRYVKDETDLSH